MVVQFRIKVKTNLVTARTFSTIARNARREMMERHSKLVLPKHFQRLAATAPGGAYQYAPRSFKYRRRKQARGKGQTPNVYSGRLRENVLTRSKITATQTRSRLTASNAGNFPLNAERRREIEIIPPAEQREHAEWLAEEVTKQINDPANQTKRKRAVKTFRA